MSEEIKGAATFQLIQGDAKTDKEIADDLRCRVTVALAEVTAILDEAARQGMVISFNLGPVPPLMRQGILQLTLAKHL